LSPFRAALVGAREVSFTVIAMSLSLVAVFIPLLLMGGVMGRMLREFSITLSVAVLISLVVSLTVTPMMCARWLRPDAKGADGRPKNRFHRGTEAIFFGMARGYASSLAWALRHQKFTLLTLLLTVCLNVFLFISVPKGFIPQQDSGRLMGHIRWDQAMSFQAVRDKLAPLMDIARN